MVGLSAFLLTVIYIGAIYYHRKFLSMISSLIGAGQPQGHGLLRTLTHLVLADVGLDSLPIIGHVLRRRRHNRPPGGPPSGPPGDGGDFSMKDHFYWWWKSRRHSDYEPNVEGTPPIDVSGAEKPDYDSSTGSGPADTDDAGGSGHEEGFASDRPVFVYADRRSAVPEEGVPPEPVDGFYNEAGFQKTREAPEALTSNTEGRSTTFTHSGESTGQKEASLEASAHQRRSAKRGGNQETRQIDWVSRSVQGTEKLSSFYADRSFGQKSSVSLGRRPRESTPPGNAVDEPGEVGARGVHSDGDTRPERAVPESDRATAQPVYINTPVLSEETQKRVLSEHRGAASDSGSPRVNGTPGYQAARHGEGFTNGRAGRQALRKTQENTAAKHVPPQAGQGNAPVIASEEGADRSEGRATENQVPPMGV